MAEAKPEPEIRLDQLTGLRTILSPARADRPFDFGGVPTEANDDGREVPVLRGPRGPHAVGDLGGPTGRR